MRVTVAARFRPLNTLEIRNGGRCAVSSQTETTVQMTERADTRVAKGLVDASLTTDRSFTFDRVFSTLSTQEQVYNDVGRPITDAFMSGFNGCLLAYGQTGSGKTHTMMGPSELLDRLSGQQRPSDSCDEDDEDVRELVANAGITPRVIFNIFETIEKSPAEMQYTLEVTMVEIYMEKVRDLLDPSPEKANLNIMTIDGLPVIVGVTKQHIGSPTELFSLIKRGNEARVVASTAMNDVSSRSHAISTLKLTTLDERAGTRTHSVLHLCDLAGSESVGKTNVGGLQLAEAGMINKSLSTLGLVINKLTDAKKGADHHIPYSSSMLTRILRTSLGGNSKTALILTCSPAEFNAPETLSTLRFGLRAKTIKQTAVLNVERSPAELRRALNALEPRHAAAATALHIVRSLLCVTRAR
jgi:kinesin family protein 5